MTILADLDSRVLVQGITGRAGRAYTELMLRHNSPIVAGTSPGKGGEWIHQLPVFDNVRAAVDATEANASVIFTRPEQAPDAIYEAADAGIPLIICVSEGVPIAETMKLREYLRHTHSRLIGPNSPGLISPNQATIGIIPGYLGISGRVGIVSRSGSLACEMLELLTHKGIGQSTCIGIGGDPIIGTDFVEILELFENDNDTDQIILIGEVGGELEYEAAEYLQQTTKTVVAYIAGTSLNTSLRPSQFNNGDGTRYTARAKIEALRRNGCRIANHLEEIPNLLLNLET